MAYIKQDLDRIKIGLNPKNHVSKKSLFLGPVQDQNISFIPMTQIIKTTEYEKEK